VLGAFQLGECLLEARNRGLVQARIDVVGRAGCAVRKGVQAFCAFGEIRDGVGARQIQGRGVHAQVHEVLAAEVHSRSVEVVAHIDIFVHELSASAEYNSINGWKIDS